MVFRSSYLGANSNLPLKVSVNQDRSCFLGIGFPVIINEAAGPFRSLQVSEAVVFITLNPISIKLS